MHCCRFATLQRGGFASGEGWFPAATLRGYLCCCGSAAKTSPCGEVMRAKILGRILRQADGGALLVRAGYPAEN
jgi:hypothetical protein